MMAKKKLKYVWCVQHEGGWCACSINRKPTEPIYNAGTRCSNVVFTPSGFDKRLPTCSACLRAIGYTSEPAVEEKEEAPKDYFAISASDGDTLITALSKQEVLEMAAEEGADKFFGPDEDFNSDPNYWPEGKVILGKVLLIKGRIVKPHAVEVATRFNVE
jgi:hypothetical protein